MRYECDFCGACCRTFPIFVTEEDAARMPRIRSEGKELPAHLAAPPWRYQLFPLPFLETCPFLGEDNRCSVYPDRPQACKNVTPGDGQCQEARRRVGLPALPPTEEEPA